ncbi:MAG: hypothetical protein IT332_13760 [Ardenticatenales bacterium]|nr:hypothetical protein [Ardenticatenales bacterium]
MTLPVEDESEAKVAKVRRKILEVEFLDHLAANCSAEVVEFVRWALAQTDDVAAGISLKWGEGGPLLRASGKMCNRKVT